MNIYDRPNYQILVRLYKNIITTLLQCSFRATAAVGHDSVSQRNTTYIIAGSRQIQTKLEIKLHVIQACANNTLPIWGIIKFGTQVFTEILRQKVLI